MNSSVANFALEALQYASISIAGTCSPLKTTGNECPDPQSTAATETEASEKLDAAISPFRLQVKRRLLREHAYLKSSDKAAMQRGLEDLFQELLQRYKHCTKSITRLAEAGAALTSKIEDR
jgi:hypothetical protein